MENTHSFIQLLKGVYFQRKVRIPGMSYFVTNKEKNIGTPGKVTQEI